MADELGLPGLGIPEQYGGSGFTFFELDAAPARRIGSAAGAGAAIEAMLDHTRIAIAADALGGTGRVLDQAVDYAKTREQFGRPIGSFQAIKHKCASMLVNLESSRA